MRDNTNKFVNNKDFGVIAKSSRGSNTPTQVGDQNLREIYNLRRDDLKNKKVGSFPMKGNTGIDDLTAGGKGKSRKR